MKEDDSQQQDQRATEIQQLNHDGPDQRQIIKLQVT